MPGFNYQQYGIGALNGPMPTNSPSYSGPPIPALEGFDNSTIPKLPNFQPITIANPAKGLPAPPEVNKSAASNLFDPFLGKAQELAKDVLDYKLAFAQIKALKKQTFGGGDNMSSAPPPVYASGGGGGSPGSSDKGGLDGTTIIVIAAIGVLILVLAMRK